MYIIKNFVYGHKLSRNKELNNNLTDLYDIEFFTNVNGKKFEVSAPYHGGQISGAIYSVIFGHLITTDEYDDFTTEMINAIKKENEYREDYNIFLKQFKDYLIKLKDKVDGTSYLISFEEYLDELFKYLDETDPEFYMVDSSS